MDFDLIKSMLSMILKAVEVDPLTTHAWPISLIGELKSSQRRNHVPN